MTMPMYLHITHDYFPATLVELSCSDRDMTHWWLRWRRICLQCKRPGFDPWIGKIPWRRKWHLTPVFLPGKPHGKMSLAGYSPLGCKRVRHN